MQAQLNGTELFFDIAGDRSATGPTLVALHGGPGFDHAYLRPGLDPLAAWAQVVHVDLRGQGRSGRPPLATCTLEQMADDVAARLFGGDMSQATLEAFGRLVAPCYAAPATPRCRSGCSP